MNDIHGKWFNNYFSRLYLVRLVALDDLAKKKVREHYGKIAEGESYFI